MKLTDLLKDYQMNHTNIQRDLFITKRSGGTLYGQYMQALREVYSRVTSLKQLYYDKELKLIEYEELIHSINTEDLNEFDLRRANLKKTKMEYDMPQLDISIASTEEEFKRFYCQAATLKEILGPLDEKRKDELDREMWEFKIKEMAYLDFNTTGSLRHGTCELLFSMPKKGRQELVDFIFKNPKGLETWFCQKDQEYTIKEFPIAIKETLNKKELMAAKGD